jgi:hypothetical protein
VAHQPPAPLGLHQRSAGDPKGLCSRPLSRWRLNPRRHLAGQSRLLGHGQQHAFQPLPQTLRFSKTRQVFLALHSPGLNVGSAVCEYTTDNWQSSTEVTCTCSGVNSTTLTQTITAADVPFNQDSNTQNWVRFSISDTSGYRGDSDAYPVYIDTTGPEAQIGAPRRLKTPSIPITWTASDGVGSGVAGYDLEVSQDGGDWTRLLTDTQDTSYPYTGEPGHAYTFPSTGSGRAAPGAETPWATPGPGSRPRSRSPA